MMSPITDFDCTISAREDFIRNDMYDIWLLNPQWEVKPSIAFIDNVGPVILTCRDHGGGTKKLSIHVPRVPKNTLPSKFSDQLAHAVLQCRTIKPVKATQYSTQFQMNEQRGSFTGIDTFTLSEYRRFDMTSKLLGESEARAIKFRPDTNALLSQLVKENAIGRSVANSKRAEAEEIVGDMNVKSLLSGATYIPFQGAMIFLNDLVSVEISVLVDDREENEPSYHRTFKKCWPSFIYPCQTMTSYGARFPMIPSIRTRNSDGVSTVESMTLWTVLGLLSRVEKLWALATTYCTRTSQWQGWILVYLSNSCFKNISTIQDKRDPFRKIKVSSALKLINKVRYDGIDIENVFSEMSEVVCIDYDGVEGMEYLLYEVDVECHVVIVMVNVSIAPCPILAVAERNYELCWISSAWETGAGWDSHCYSRHFGSEFKDWWYQKRFQKLTCHSEQPDFENFDLSKPMILCFVRVGDDNFDEAKLDFMSHLGGKKNVHCQEHKTPLICSMERKCHCKCGRIEHYRCCTLGCKTCLCKRCIDGLNPDIVHYIVSGDELRDSNHIDDDEEEEVYSVQSNDDDFSLENEDLVLGADDFDEFVTRSEDPDSAEDFFFVEGEIHGGVQIPTTDAGEVGFESITEQGEEKCLRVNGRVILNQCCSLLARSNHEISGSRESRYFLQKIHSTSPGKCMPLLYPEFMLFPSIFFHPGGDGLSGLGAIPTPLLTKNIGRCGFESISQMVRSRLTTPASNTNSDPRYHSFVYDMLCNLSANHFDTRIFLQNGLTSGDDEKGGLCLRGKGGDGGLLESFDSNAIVKNLCSSQAYHSFDYFITYTVNQKQHFGVKMIKIWVDSAEWEQHYPDFHILPKHEQKEIREAMIQASAGLLLRNWQETTMLFINYIRKSPSSPFRKVNSIFVRYEYQKDVGNLCHLHLILEVNWKELSESETSFVKDLIRASILDIVRTNEVQALINEGIFQSMDNYEDMISDAEKYLPHKCSQRCQMRTGPGPNDFRCRKLNNRLITEDNTKHTFKSLPNEWSFDCLQRLIKVGIVLPLCVNADGYQAPVQFTMDFFKPKRHIPPINPSDDRNISPVEGKTFSMCRSMQNIQLLTDCGGVNKYVCKYIGKIDEKNFVVAKVDGRGQLVTRNEFLHNTKVETTKINEDKARLSSRENARGRGVSHMEMLHALNKYYEVKTDLNFINVPTVILELRAGVETRDSTTRVANHGTDLYQDIEDGMHIGFMSHDIRSAKDSLPGWRTHTGNEVLTFEGAKASKFSIDKITKFSLRPPELRYLFNTLREYYRWFEYTSRTLKGEELDSVLDGELGSLIFVDALMFQVKVRREAMPEVIAYIEGRVRDIESEDDVEKKESLEVMMTFFSDINIVLNSNPDELSISDNEFLNHVQRDLVISHEDGYHLPVPVFSYTKPTMGIQFILHILLSLGQFETEIDLTTHASIRECLRYAKLIGPSNEPEDLEEYSNQLLLRYIKEQVVLFPSSKRIIQSWIVVAGDLFDGVIIHDEIPITDLPPVQHSSLYRDISEEKIAYVNEIRAKLADAALKELGEETVELCNIPPKEDLVSAKKESPLNWDGLSNFKKTVRQPEASYSEQKLAIRACIEAIDKYCCLDNKFVKCTGIRGFPGSGKTWTMEYCVLYALSKGLICITTSLMARRSIQLGGRHLAYLFCLPFEKNLSSHRKADLALQKIIRDPKKHDFLLALDIMFIDELGQLSSEMVAILDIILRRLKNNHIFLGGVLVMFSLDHTQIQPFDARPFLTSSHILPCFRMVALETSVRACEDHEFQRVQQLARSPHWKLAEDPALLEEFVEIVSRIFTFVDNWSSPLITPSTRRLYSKKVPAKEATCQYVERVRRQVSQFRCRKSDDVEKGRYTHSEWRPASQFSIDQLDQKSKEPNELLFFRGAEYEFTCNQEGLFSQKQVAILYDLPSQEDLDSFRKVSVLAAPPGMKSNHLSIQESKEAFLDDGFKEVKVGVAPDRAKSLKGDIQAKRKQYSLRHRVASTVHAAQGETIPHMGTEISSYDSDYGIWDKGQVVVILSRTKRASDTVFVGNKVDTLKALKVVLMKKTQWSDYIERVLELVTTNRSNNDDVNRRREDVMNQNQFPFRVCDIALPQCRTGFVYFIASIKQPSFTYIGTTVCLRERLLNHNSGYGSTSTTPEYLRPYAMMGYICGFDGRNVELRYHIERQWKIKRNRLVRRGNNCLKDLVMVARAIIQEVSIGSTYNIEHNDLQLVCLFRD